MLAGLLFDVSAPDTLTFAAVALLPAGVALTSWQVALYCIFFSFLLNGYSRGLIVFTFDFAFDKAPALRF